MSDHDLLKEYPKRRWRDHWAVRVFDWFASWFTPAAFVTCVLFGAHLVRVHSHVMDEVHQTLTDQKKVNERLESDEKNTAELKLALATLNGKVDMIVDGVKEIKRRLP